MKKGLQTLRAKLILAFIIIALIPLFVLAWLNNQVTKKALTDAANKTLKVPHLCVTIQSALTS